MKAFGEQTWAGELLGCFAAVLHDRHQGSIAGKELLLDRPAVLEPGKAVTPMGEAVKHMDWAAGLVLRGLGADWEKYEEGVAVVEAVEVVAAESVLDAGVAAAD